MKRLFTAWLVALLAFGCGREVYQLAPVSGTVAMDGKPLANVHVTFVPLGSKDNPEPGPGSRGMTNSEGRFVLTTTTGRRGAVVGKHRVSIEAEQEGVGPDGEQPDGAESDEAMRKRVEASLNTIPTRYNYETELTFEVPAGGVNDAHFELSKL